MILCPATTRLVWSFKMFTILSLLLAAALFLFYDRDHSTFP